MDRVIQKSSNKNLKYLSIGIIVALGLWLLLHKLNAETGPEIDQAHTAISEVTQSKFEDVIPVRATVEPIITVFMDAVEGGQIEKILIEEGQFVAAGDTILRLANTRLQLDVISREAEISRQISNLQNTRLAIEQNKLQLDMDLLDVNFDIDRTKRQLESFNDMDSNQFFSEQEYKDIQNELTKWVERRKVILESQALDRRIRSTQLANLQSNIDNLQENLIVVRSILDKLDVKAPVSGRLTSLNAELGQSILQGQRIGQIDDEERFRTTAQVSEHYINQVAVGQWADFNLGGKKYAQRISKVYPQVTGGHFKIDLEFTGDVPDNIRRGQKLSLKLKLNDEEQLVVIENGPFFNDTGGAWVFVAEAEDQVFKKRFVQLGRRTPSQIEVVNGLALGEKVLTSAYTNYMNVDSLTIR